MKVINDGDPENQYDDNDEMFATYKGRVFREEDGSSIVIIYMIMKIIIKPSYK